MVNFATRTSGAVDTFTITLYGDESTYIDTLTTLATLFSRFDKDLQLTQNEMYCLCNLLEAMLPTYEQLNIKK